ncbi:MAG: multiheme c-type cytochrome, partial [Pirellulaceae bacterium]|nr:multiheme c-type cytochrome [Pirellulaceae bacterium]
MNKSNDTSGAAASEHGSTRWLTRLSVAAWLLVVGVIVGSWTLCDWLIAVPEDVEVRYVGRSKCTTCHQPQAEQWQGSHHDKAMDQALEETVLGDFNDAELVHHGITSRMFRQHGKFMVHTEGPDGKMTDFEIKYVFGVDPLQQYMVEFDRPESLPDDGQHVGRLQV